MFKIISWGLRQQFYGLVATCSLIIVHTQFLNDLVSSFSCDKLDLVDFYSFSRLDGYL